MNAGRFGSLFASFANLIAYRLYITHDGAENIARFTTRFLIAGYVALFLSVALFLLLHPAVTGP